MGAICTYGLDNLTDFSSMLFVGLLLFANMMREDAYCLTVDIRKTALLGLLLLIATNEPRGNFLLTFGLAFIFFRWLHLATLIRSTYKRNVLPDTVIGGQSADLALPLPLLPSFGVALCLVSLFLCGHSEPTFLVEMRSSMTEIGTLLVTTNWLWPFVLAIWFILEYAYHRLQKQGADMVEGLGMGDVLVLPIFAAFLGLTLFGVVLLFACLIQLGHYFTRYITFKEAW